MLVVEVKVTNRSNISVQDLVLSGLALRDKEQGMGHPGKIIWLVEQNPETVFTMGQESKPGITVSQESWIQDKSSGYNGRLSQNSR